MLHALDRHESAALELVRTWEDETLSAIGLAGMS
jgi:hypothetical protein